MSAAPLVVSGILPLTFFTGFISEELESAEVELLPLLLQAVALNIKIAAKNFFMFLFYLLLSNYRPGLYPYRF
jgi:hypothetical protein